MGKYSKVGQAIDDNTSHVHCMLDNKGYRPTLRIMKYLLLFYCNNGCKKAS